jgi:hypothetical protein
VSATQLRGVGELEKALAIDQHGIELIPDGDRDSTAWQQFGVFTLMGKRTGVSQFALSRMAFGRRGNNVPSIINGLITLAWIGVYTYVVLDLATYCLHELGLPDNDATEYSVAAVIMIIQLIIGTLGFYAIRTFEKGTGRPRWARASR